MVDYPHMQTGGILFTANSWPYQSLDIFPFGGLQIPYLAGGFWDCSPPPPKNSISKLCSKHKGIHNECPCPSTARIQELTMLKGDKVSKTKICLGYLNINKCAEIYLNK